MYINFYDVSIDNYEGHLWTTKLSIPDIIADSTKSAEVIANETNTNNNALYRVIT